MSNLESEMLASMGVEDILAGHDTADVDSMFGGNEVMMSSDPMADFENQSFSAPSAGFEDVTANVDSTVLNVDTLRNVKISVSVVLGKTELSWDELQGLKKGSVLKLDTKKEDNLTLTINNQPVAKCSVELINGEYHVIVQELQGA